MFYSAYSGDEKKKPWESNWKGGNIDIDIDVNNKGGGGKHHHHDKIEVTEVIHIHDKHSPISECKYDRKAKRWIYTRGNRSATGRSCSDAINKWNDMYPPRVTGWPVVIYDPGPPIRYPVPVLMPAPVIYPVYSAVPSHTTVVMNNERPSVETSGGRKEEAPLPSPPQAAPAGFSMEGMPPWLIPVGGVAVLLLVIMMVKK